MSILHCCWAKVAVCKHAAVIPGKIHTAIIVAFAATVDGSIGVPDPSSKSKGSRVTTSFGIRTRPNFPFNLISPPGYIQFNQSFRKP